MPNNVNTKSGIRATVLFCTLSFPSTLLAQSSVPVGSTIQNSGTQNATVTRQTNLANVQSPSFSGVWRLNLSTGQRQERQAAIEGAISRLGRFKGRARQVVDRMTSPENQLKITDSGSQIKITREGREFTIALNGQPVAINLGQRNASMRAVKRDGKLIIVSSMANATQTATYELSADGKYMKQTVDMSGGRLPTPIRYTNTYVRYDRR